MDIEKIFNEGGYTVPNPKYDKKKKKNSEPPTILSTDVNKYGSTTASGMYNSTSDFWLMGDTDKYQEYGIAPRPGIDLDKELASRQSNWKKVFNSLGQTLISEIGIGTVKGFSDLFGYIGGKLGMTDDPYHNAVSDMFANWQNYLTEEAMPIYVDPNLNISNGGLTDVGWYAKNFPSVASSLTLLLPARGVTGGISKLGKALNADKALAGTVKWLGATNKLNQGKKLNYLQKLLNDPIKRATAKEATKTLGEAYLMRTMENYQEAGEVHNQTYDEAYREFSKMNDAEYNAWVDKNRKLFEDEEGNVGIDLSNRDEAAKAVAKKAADKTFGMDFANIVFDFTQLWTLKNIGTTLRKATGSGIAKAQQESIKDLVKIGAEKAGREIAEDVTKKAVLSKAFKPVGNFLKDFGSMMAGEATEGIEEAVNYIAQQEGINYGRMMIKGVTEDRNKSTFGEALSTVLNSYDLFKTYKDSPELWEQAFWGLAGGVIFGGATNAINKYQTKKANLKHLDELRKQGVDVDAMQAQYPTLSLYDNSETQSAKIALQKRVNLIEELAKDKQNIKDNKDIYSERNQDGSYKEFTDNAALEQEFATARREEEFRADIAKMALDAGTYDQTVAFFQSDNVKQAMIDLGVTTAEDADGFISSTLATMEKVKDIYSEQTAAVMAQATEINADKRYKEKVPLEYVRMVASQNTSQLVNIDMIDKHIAMLDAKDADIIATLRKSEGEDAVAQYMKDKQLIKLGALTDWYSRLEADKQYIKEHGDGSIENRAELKNIETQQKQLAKLIRDTGYGNMLNALKTASTYRKVVQDDGTGRSTIQYFKDTQAEADIFAKTDAQLVKEYESILKGGNDVTFSADEAANINTIAKVVHQDLENINSSNGLKAKHKELFDIYARRGVLEFNRTYALSHVATTRDQVMDRIDLIHNRLNTARLQAIKESDIIINDLYKNYKDVAGDSIEKAIVSVLDGNRENAKNELLKFMPESDVNEFFSAVEVLRFTNASNAQIASYIIDGIQKQKELDARQKAAEEAKNSTTDNTQPTPAPTDNQNLSSSASQNQSQTSQNQQTDNPINPQSQSNTGSPMQSSPQSLDEALKNINGDQNQQNGSEDAEVPFVSITVNRDGSINATKAADSLQATTKKLADGTYELEADVLQARDGSIPGIWISSDMFDVDNPKGLPNFDKNSIVTIDKNPIFEGKGDKLILKEKGHITISSPIEDMDNTADNPEATPEATPEESKEKPKGSIKDFSVKRVKATVSTRNGTTVTKYTATDSKGNEIPGAGTRLFNEDAIDGISVDKSIFKGKVVQLLELVEQSNGTFTGTLSIRDSFESEGYSTRNVSFISDPLDVLPFGDDTSGTMPSLDDVAAELATKREELQDKISEYMQANNINPSNFNLDLEQLGKDLKVAFPDAEYKNIIDDIIKKAETARKRFIELKRRNTLNTIPADELYSDIISSVRMTYTNPDDLDYINQILYHLDDASYGEKGYIISYARTCYIEQTDKPSTGADINTLKESFKGLVGTYKGSFDLYNDFFDKLRVAASTYTPDINSAAAQMGYFARFESPDTTFSDLFKFSAESFIDKYAEVSYLPKIDGKQVIRMKDLLLLCRDAYGSSTGGVADAFFQVLKAYLTNRQADPNNKSREKYIILDEDDVNSGEILKKLYGDDINVISDREGSPVVRLDLQAVSDLIDNFGTKQEKQDFLDALNSIKKGDELQVIDKDNTLYIQKNGITVASYNKPTVLVDGSIRYTAGGFVVRAKRDIKGVVQSDYKTWIKGVFLNDDIFSSNLRGIILKAYLERKNNKKISDATLNEFRNNSIIDKLYSDSEQEGLNNLLFNEDGKLPDVKRVLSHLINVSIAYFENEGISTDLETNKSAISDSLDNWFEKQYVTFNATSSITTGGEVTVEYVNFGNLIRNKELKQGEKVSYDECNYIADALGTDHEFRLTVAKNYKGYISGRQTQSEGFESLAFGTLISAFDNNGHPYYTQAWGVQCNDKNALSNNPAFKKIYNGALDSFTNFLRSAPTTEAMTRELSKLVRMLTNSKNNDIVPLFKAVNGQFRVGKRGDDHLEIIYVNNGKEEKLVIFTRNKKSPGYILGCGTENIPGIPNGVKFNTYNGADAAAEIRKALSALLEAHAQININEQCVALDNAENNTKAGYFSKENGKVKLRIPNVGIDLEYDSYNDYIFKNNLIKVNLKKNKNGENFEKFTENDLNKQVLFVSLPKAPVVTNPAAKYEHVDDTDRFVVQQMDSAKAIIDSDSKNKARELINQALDENEKQRFDKVISDFQSTFDKFNINDLLPENIEYAPEMNEWITSDNNPHWLGVMAASKGSNKNGYYPIYRNGVKSNVTGIKDNTAYVGLRWLNAIASKYKVRRHNAIGILIHENLHNKLAKDQAKREKLLGSLHDVRKQFVEELNARISPLRDKGLDNLSNDERKIFTIYDQCLRTINSMQTKNGKTEEFLVNSLTNKAFYNILNSIYVDDVGTGTKQSLFSYILEKLAEFFGWDKVKAGTLLEKEFNILRNIGETSTNTEDLNISPPIEGSDSSDENLTNQEEQPTKQEGQPVEPVVPDFLNLDGVNLGPEGYFTPEEVISNGINFDTRITTIQDVSSLEAALGKISVENRDKFKALVDASYYELVCK